MNKNDQITYYQEQINFIEQGFLEDSKGGDCFCDDCCLASSRIERLQEAIKEMQKSIINEREAPGSAAQ